MVAVNDALERVISMTDIEQVVRRSIATRAGRGVSQIQVTANQRRLTVRGTAESFYAWQLVQAACREALASFRDFSLDCAMTVSYGQQNK
jgi:hypothetical protein